jgi:hypothetical protein
MEFDDLSTRVIGGAIEVHVSSSDSFVLFVYFVVL